MGLRTLGLAVLQVVLTILPASAAVTVYPTATTTIATSAANYTGAAAYDPTILNPPPVPSALSTKFVIQLQNNNSASLPHRQNGSFIGFSIEMSVVNQVCKCTILQGSQYSHLICQWARTR